MSCGINDVEFLLEVISDHVRKTFARLGTFKAHVKNQVCGEAEVFRETERRSLFSSCIWLTNLANIRRLTKNRLLLGVRKCQN